MSHCLVQHLQPSIVCSDGECAFLEHRLHVLIGTKDWKPGLNLSCGQTLMRNVAGLRGRYAA